MHASATAPGNGDTAPLFPCFHGGGIVFFSVSVVCFVSHDPSVDFVDASETTARFLDAPAVIVQL